MDEKFKKIAQNLKYSDIQHVQEKTFGVTSVRTGGRIEYMIQMVSSYDFDKAIFVDHRPTWEESCEALRIFEEAHSGSIYYARPAEDFSLQEACKIAYNNNKKFVIVENMS